MNTHRDAIPSSSFRFSSIIFHTTTFSLSQNLNKSKSQIQIELKYARTGDYVDSLKTFLGKETTQIDRGKLTNVNKHKNETKYKMNFDYYIGGL